MAKNPAPRDDISYIAPGIDLIPVTPSDDTDLATEGRGIRCKPVTGTAGDLAFITIAGQTRTTEIDVGETLVVGVRRILDTGTTATGLEVYI